MSSTSNVTPYTEPRSHARSICSIAAVYAASPHIDTMIAGTPMGAPRPSVKSDSSSPALAPADANAPATDAFWHTRLMIASARCSVLSRGYTRSQWPTPMRWLWRRDVIDRELAEPAWPLSTRSIPSRDVDVTERMSVPPASSLVIRPNAGAGRHGATSTAGAGAASGLRITLSTARSNSAQRRERDVRRGFCGRVGQRVVGVTAEVYSVSATAW